MTWTNYSEVFKAIPFLRQFGNTVLFAGAVTLFSLFFDSMTGYALARLEFPGKRLLFLAVLLFLMLPAQVTLVPVYQLLSHLPSCSLRVTTGRRHGCGDRVHRLRDRTDQLRPEVPALDQTTDRRPSARRPQRDRAASEARCTHPRRSEEGLRLRVGEDLHLGAVVQRQFRAEFANSGLGEVNKAELEQFGTGFALGMDPLEVGEKIVRGMTRNDALILSHPEHGEDFQEIFEASMAALPIEEAPEGRLHIERLRRAANRAAAAGTKIELSDLT